MEKVQRLIWLMMLICIVSCGEEDVDGAHMIEWSVKSADSSIQTKLIKDKSTAELSVGLKGGCVVLNPNCNIIIKIKPDSIDFANEGSESYDTEWYNVVSESGKVTLTFKERKLGDKYSKDKLYAGDFVNIGWIEIIPTDK